MTWKQFVRRFKEITADSSVTTLGVADLEAWHEEQKKITERRLREEQEKRERAKNRLSRDAYTKASLPKKLWMCLQYIYWDIRGQMHHPKIPDHIIQEMARCLLPDLIAFYETEEGKAAFAQWKVEQDAKKKEQSKVA